VGCTTSTTQNIAAGVAYSTVPGCSRQFFRCTVYNATLSQEACASRFTASQEAKDEALEAVRLCRICPIGAAHAGAPVPHYSKLFGSIICPRCHRGTLRMIQGRVCVSCRNREYELRAGRNRRGTRPIKAARLHELVVRYVIDGQQQTLTTVGFNSTEALVQVLRTKRGVTLRQRTSFAPVSMWPCVRMTTTRSMRVMLSSGC
jgi:hypothetical protein